MDSISERYFKKLEKALKVNKILQSNVSFGSFEDDSICIEEEGSKWIVYSVDRGNKFEQKPYESIEDACHDVIHRATGSEAEEIATKTYFDDLFNRGKMGQEAILNKTALIAELAAKTQMSRKNSGVVVNALLDVLTECMAKGDKVQLIGFGTFEAKNRPARVARNPRTGAALKIAACKAPSFKAGKALKDAVAAKKKLSGTAKVVKPAKTTMNKTKKSANKKKT